MKIGIVFFLIPRMIDVFMAAFEADVFPETVVMAIRSKFLIAIRIA